MSDAPVRLVAVLLPGDRQYSVRLKRRNGRQLGVVSDSGYVRKDKRGDTKWGFALSLDAAALALARACGYPNALPPEVWP